MPPTQQSDPDQVQALAMAYKEIQRGSFAALQFPFAQEEHSMLTVKDHNGRYVLIRPLAQKDRDREYAFIKRLSPESRHMRFLAQINEPGAAMLDQLMDTDNHRRLAYIALVHDNGKLVEIGISRYAATGEHECECAVTVADEWTHLGLGKILMDHLIKAARKNGFRQMYSVDAASNTPMRDLARALGFETHNDPDDSHQVIHRLNL
jgi:GNAT superfamily N-acetyltransferase